MEMKDYLKDKNILFFGDSITHNWFKWGHNFEPANLDTKDFAGYVGIIKDNVNAKSIENVAVSGGCFCDCSTWVDYRQDFRHFPYQVDHAIDLIKKADVIFIFFGANDYSEQVLFGKNTTDDIKTFHGGINHGIEMIKKENPNAKIFMLNMLYRTCPIDSKTFSYSINEYNLAIKERCLAQNINLIDVSNIFNDDNINELTNDGLHPNEKGAKVLADKILKEII